MTEEAITVAQAAQLLDVTAHAVRHHIRTGRLKHKRPYGLAYVVRRKDVLALRGELQGGKRRGRPKGKAKTAP